MRKKFVLAVALTSVLASGCGLFVKSAGQKSAEDLSRGLLTVTDMPKGWEETQRQVFETRGNENPSIDPSVWCKESVGDSAGLVALAGDSGADVEMNWAQGTGPRMMRLQAWSNKDASSYFVAAKKSAESCDGVTATDASGVTTETQLITGRTVGDESVSWSDRTTPPQSIVKDKFESVGRTTVARFGKTIMVLQLGDAAPVGTASLMAEDDWWAIVKLAADKLEKVAK